MKAQKFYGFVFSIGQTEQIGPKGSLRRSIVIETSAPGSQYSTYLEVEFWNDRTQLLDGVAEGEKVQIDAYVDSRFSERHDRWFTSVRGVNVQSMVQQKYGPQPQQSQGQYSQSPTYSRQPQQPQRGQYQGHQVTNAGQGFNTNSSRFAPSPEPKDGMGNKSPF